MEPERTLPLVLAVGGHDPSGGAGLQADIETLAANGCRALTVVTALTTQNTCGVAALMPQPARQVETQIRFLLEESTPAAIKIGLLGSPEVARTLAALLQEHTHIPVILDPVLAASSGVALTDVELREAIVTLLCPCCTLITPNRPEAESLTGQTDPAVAALRLIAHGCATTLITGTHDELQPQVVNRLYGLSGLMQELSWPRLPGSFHGSGCTLASAAAAGLAQGLKVPDAVARAQDYTWCSLRSALRTGRCQYTPNRFHDHTPI
jgi:hydroxymethylpyrimidine/phosphomethylpyrimidine kinase